MHVLLVEDNARVRRLVRTVLERAGLRVTDAANPAEALAITVMLRPDLLVTDYMMPGMNGIELANYLLEQFPSIAVLVISGSYLEELHGPLPRSAIFLEKPFTSDDLIMAVRKGNEAAAARHKRRSPTLGAWPSRATSSQQKPA